MQQHLATPTLSLSTHSQRYHHLFTLVLSSLGQAHAASRDHAHTVITWPRPKLSYLFHYLDRYRDHHLAISANASRHLITLAAGGGAGDVGLSCLSRVQWRSSVR